MAAALRALALAAVIAAGCSVPDVALDGKKCPCASGYVCETSSNTCRTSLTDGGTGGPTCLGPEPSGPLFSDTFDSGTLDWTHTTMFAESGGQLVQSDTTDPLAFAYPNTPGGAATATRYRIVAQMSGTAGGTGMGIAFRVQAGQRSQYDCLWDPGASAGALLIQEVKNSGQATTIGSNAGLANPGATATYTMEVLVDNGNFTCCLDNVAAATVMATSATYAAGPPGVVTSLMRASFDNFAVYSN